MNVAEAPFAEWGELRGFWSQILFAIEI